MINYELLILKVLEITKEIDTFAKIHTYLYLLHVKSIDKYDYSNPIFLLGEQFVLKYLEEEYYYPYNEDLHKAIDEIIRGGLIHTGTNSSKFKLTESGKEFLEQFSHQKYVEFEMNYITNHLPEIANREDVFAYFKEKAMINIQKIGDILP